MNIRALLSVFASAGLAFAATADTVVQVTESQTLFASDLTADTRFEIGNGVVLTLDIGQNVACKGATGTGKIVKTGSGRLDFSNPEAGGQVDGGLEVEILAGQLRFVEGRLGTATITIGADGSLENYGWPTFNGTLTVDNATDKGIFSNPGGNPSTLLGTGGFVKTGAGRLTVNSQFGISGAVRIDEGVLVFARDGNFSRGSISELSGNGSYRLAQSDIARDLPASEALFSYFNFNGNQVDHGVAPLDNSHQSSSDASRYETTDRGKAVQVAEVNPMTAMYGGNANLGSGDFTVVVRAKTQKQDKTVLLSYGQRNGGAIGLRTDADGNVQFTAWKSNAIAAQSDYASVSAPTERYHLYAMAYDSSAQTMSFYADGSLVGAAVPYECDLAGNQFQFGAIHGGTDGADSVKSTAVYLDELRTYHRAMTAADIAALAAEMPVWPSGNTWTNAAGDSDWSNTENWSYGRLPSSGDEIIVEIDGDTTLTVPSALMVGFLTVSGNGTLIFSNANLTFATAKIEQGATVAYPVDSDKTMTTTLTGKGAFKKTGSAQLALNNGSLGRIADGGVTIEVAEGKLLCNSGAGDPAFGEVKFVLGDDESVALENFGWMDFYGTVTFSTSGEKAVFNNNNYQGTGGNSTIRQNGKIVKEGTGTIIFKSRLDNKSNPIEVNGGKFLLSIRSGMDYAWSGTVSGTGRFGKTGEGHLTVTAAQDFRGGVEIVEGELVLENSSQSTTYGIYGEGTLVNGAGALLLARGGDGYSLLDATVRLTAGPANLGGSGVDGATIKDGTLVLDGGTFTGWGWPTFESVTIDCRQDATVFDGTNSGHSIQNGQIVKTGSGTLTINAHLRKATTIALAEGAVAVKSARTIEETVVVKPVDEMAEKFRVVKSTTSEGDPLYTLEKRGGFAVIIM